MSCGQIALERAGIKVDKYFASEIDKYAISITMKNFPNTHQLGDVTQLKKEKLSNLPKIDLLIGGSPCQGLSNCNVYLKDGEYGVNGTGESRLFWEYVRIYKTLKEENPNLQFLLENVGSAKLEDKKIIDEELGVKGIPFNSNLLSAQYRNRVYWTNIEFETPKVRKNLFMKDILECEIDDKYYITPKMYDYIMCTDTGNWQTGKMDINLDIARPLTATMHKMHRADTDNYVSSEYSPTGKTNIRRLTPLECERLQTLPDHYTSLGQKDDGKVVKISDTRRYMVIGNGWTVDVIAHIFKHIALKDKLLHNSTYTNEKTPYKKAE